MHSFLTRCNSVAAYTLSVLACLTLLCFFSTAFIDYRTVTEISIPTALVNLTVYSFLITLVDREIFSTGGKHFKLVITDATRRNYKNKVKQVPNFNTGRERNDLGHITVNLKADLNPLFNWNVRQLFVYLIAEYTTEANVINQVILWDKIIRRGEDAKLNHKKLNLKYYFWDDGNGLLANNVTLNLSWNIIPNAGCLPHVAAIGSHEFRFPSEYTTTRQ